MKSIFYSYHSFFSIKKSFFLLLIGAFCLQSGYTQCRYSGIPGKLKRYCVSDSKPDADYITTLTLLFDKYSFQGLTSFAKAGAQYYLYLHLTRDMSNRFELNKENPLLLTMESGKQLEIFPNGNYSGKKMMTIFSIGSYYTLSKEQLQMLTSENVSLITVYLNTSGDNEVETIPDDGTTGWKKDKNNNILYRHQMEREEPKEKFRKAAECILLKG